MFWLLKLKEIASLLFRTNGHRDMVAIPEVDYPVLRKEDALLSEHFSLFELTSTTNAALQDANRTLTNEQIEKLRALANHAEVIREICGAPVNVHSGYRSAALNGSTVGSSSTSQHPRCEALDLDIKGQAITDTFNKLLAAAKAGKFKFGQLIVEKAQRDYGVVQWVHCSVIGTLEEEKIGQVMIMEAGADGKPKYTLVDRLKF